MKRVAAGAHLPTPWLFEPAKHPDDRAEILPGLQFPLLVQAPGTRFRVEWLPVNKRYITQTCHS